jgi:signal transduction histidine kinase
LTTRTRIFAACLAAAVLPLALLAAGTRSVVRDRLTAQYEQRVAAARDAVHAAIAQRNATIDARLTSLAARLADDPRLRAALAGAADRAELIDYAPAAMAAAGLDYLLLLDSAGSVLSSGHFRNEYDRVAPALRTVAAATQPVLVDARRADGSFTALVRARSLTVNGRSHVLVGGVALDSAASLAPSGDSLLAIRLLTPSTAGADPTAAALVGERIAATFIAGDGTTSADAAWQITHSLEPLRAVLRDIDRWFLLALAAAAFVAILAARILAARVNRPLEDLAQQAGRVGLDRYDVRFTTARRDEVGTLARVLDTMVQRLRSGALQLRDAERRATVGDMARQVNHDIRNGLLPIRNVIRHLHDVAADAPAQLPAVFAERATTLTGGIGYLESLAASYARLTPRLERHSCDINPLVRQIVQDSPHGALLQTELARALPAVLADPVALRRVIDNLVINGVEALPDAGGSVTVRTDARTGAEPDDGVVVITVRDTGTGMDEPTVARIFDDFYSTKERGSGLGLSIVRRLVADMGGRISVDSAPGRGTTFTVELPAAGSSGLHADAEPTGQ